MTSQAFVHRAEERLSQQDCHVISSDRVGSLRRLFGFSHALVKAHPLQPHQAHLIATEHLLFPSLSPMKLL